MYKVLREVVEDTSTGSRSNLDIGTGGRVRDNNLKSLIAKQLGGALGNLESQPQMDLKTGRIASRKAKKEKTPAQLAQQDVKTLVSKFLFLEFYLGFFIASSPTIDIPTIPE